MSLRFPACRVAGGSCEQPKRKEPEMAKEKTKERKEAKERKVKRKQDGVIYITPLKTAHARAGARERRVSAAACQRGGRARAAALRQKEQGDGEPLRPRRLRLLLAQAVGKDGACGAFVFPRPEKSQRIFSGLQTKGETGVGAYSERQLVAVKRVFAHYCRGGMWLAGVQGNRVGRPPQAKPRRGVWQIFDKRRNDETRARQGTAKATSAAEDAGNAKPLRR